MFQILINKLDKLQEVLHKHRVSIFVVFVLFILMSLFLRSFQYVSLARDSYWHLKIGLDFIEKGLSPLVDHYSINQQGQSYGATMPVTFQVFIALVHNIVGAEYAISSALFIIFSLVLLLFLGVMRRLKVSLWLTCVGAVLIYLAMFLRPLLRPEIGSFIFELLILPLFVDCLNKWNQKKLLWLALFILVWNNYHASAIFGFVILGAMYLELITREIQARATKNIISLCVWGSFTFSMGFLSHSMAHPVLSSIYFPEVWTQFIDEYKKFPVSNFLFISQYWISAFCLILYFSKRQWAYLILNIVLTYNMWKLNKLFPHCSIILISIFLVSLQDTINQLSQSNLSILKRYKPVIGFLMVIVLLQYHVGGTSNERHTHMKNFPVRTADYLEVKHKKGNIFNSYADGGYFLYRNSPDIKVFIDGRTQVLYSADFYKNRWYDTHFSPMSFFYETRHSDLKFVSSRNHDEVGSIELALRTGAYDFEFADEDFTLLERREVSWKLARELALYPGCVGQLDYTNLTDELKRAGESDEFRDTYVHRLLKMANDYLLAKDKKAFIAKVQLPRKYTLFELRLLTQILIMNEVAPIALELYGVVDKGWLLERDLLVIVSLLLEKKDPTLEQVKSYILTLSFLMQKMPKRDKAHFLHLVEKYISLSKDKSILPNTTKNKILTNIQKEYEETKNLKAKDVFNFGCNSKTEYHFKTSSTNL